MARDVTFLVHFSVYPCSCTVELALQHLSDHFSPWRMQWGIVGVCLSAWYALDQPKALHVFSELTTGAAFFFFVFSVFSDFSGFSRVSAFSAAGVVATSAAASAPAGAALAAWKKDMLNSDFFPKKKDTKFQTQFWLKTSLRSSGHFGHIRFLGSGSFWRGHTVRRIFPHKCWSRFLKAINKTKQTKHKTSSIFCLPSNYIIS